MDPGALGVGLIVVGVVLLISEVLVPGFFIAIPGSVILVLGIIGMIEPSFLESQWAPILVLVVAIPTFFATIYFYKKFGPVAPPITTAATSLEGREGKVTTAIDPDSLKGKVKIDQQLWSATSNVKIPVGATVVVVKSQGVHVNVKLIQRIGDNMKGGDKMSIELLLFLALLLFLLLAYLARSAIYIIRPYEQGLYERLGSFRGVLNPGFNIVTPLVSRVIKMDLRTQPLDVPAQEVITKDNAPTRVDAIIYIKVIDPKKAYYEVQFYNRATVYLAQTTLRSVIGDMELDEIFYNRTRINTRLRDLLDEATDAWGVKVENVEIREVDPVPRVKQAMEEQTSAERERRAAIRRADGEKRAAILRAEGGKRSRILEAEGVRQSKILEAEGQRMATILESQGEAQKLRILAMGSLPLDSKALTVLSLDTLKSVGNGQATKIIFPFELTKIVQGAADYLGVGAETKEHTPVNADEMERLVGKADDVLGKIPKHSELKKELDQIEKDMANIAEEALPHSLKTETDVLE